MHNIFCSLFLAPIFHQLNFSQGKAQTAQQVSEDSGNKLPQAVSSIDPAEKSIGPKGKPFD